MIIKRYNLCSEGNRAAAFAYIIANEESPGFTETGHQITSGWRNPRESAAENYRRDVYCGKVEKAR